MAIELERFSRLKSPWQGADVHELVMGQQDWLEEVQPDTVRRYKDVKRSVRNVARLSASRQMEAYIVRDEKIPKGLATIIFRQTISHPSEGEISGDDLDYWLTPDSGPGVHQETAYHLLFAQGQIDYDRNEDYWALRPGNPHVMATIPVEHPNPSVGFESVMPKIGGPAVLSTPTGNDPFGITKGGALLQLYGYEISRL